MRWPLLLLVVIALVLIQTTFVRWIEIAGVKPDLMLILVVYVSLHARPEDSFANSLLVGLWKDIYSTERFGLYMLLYAACGVVVNHVRKDLFKEHFVTQMMVVFTCACGCNLIVSAVHMLRFGLLNVGQFLWLSIAGAAYTAAVAPLGFFVLKKLRRAIGPRREPVFDNA